MSCLFPMCLTLLFLLQLFTKQPNTIRELAANTMYLSQKSEIRKISGKTLFGIRSMVILLTFILFNEIMHTERQVYVLILLHAQTDCDMRWDVEYNGGIENAHEGSLREMGNDWP